MINFRGGNRVVWRSLTPPSKMGKGSGEPRIIDLCRIAAAPIRFQNVILVTSFRLRYYIIIFTRALHITPKDGGC